MPEVLNSMKPDAPKRKRKRRTDARVAKDAATDLHAELVRARGACENCGVTDPSRLQCAHIKSRRYVATRTDLGNAFCLCAGCHMFFTENPHEFTRFTFDKIGEAAYDELHNRAMAGAKSSEAFWKSEVERLSALLGRAA